MGLQISRDFQSGDFQSGDFHIQSENKVGGIFLSLTLRDLGFGIFYAPSFDFVWVCIYLRIFSLGNFCVHNFYKPYVSS